MIMGIKGLQNLWIKLQRRLENYFFGCHVISVTLTSWSDNLLEHQPEKENVVQLPIAEID